MFPMHVVFMYIAHWLQYAHSTWDIIPLWWVEMPIYTLFGYFLLLQILKICFLNKFDKFMPAVMYDGNRNCIYRIDNKNSSFFLHICYCMNSLFCCFYLCDVCWLLCTSRMWVAITGQASGPDSLITNQHRCWSKNHLLIFVVLPGCLQIPVLTYVCINIIS